MDGPVNIGPHVKAVDKDGLTTSGVVGLSIGSAIFILLILGVTCLCLKKRRGRGKKFSERPLTLRKPTAVRNPTAHSHYLKKSPSPTGIKSPPGGIRTSPSGLPLPGTRTPHGLSSKSNSPNDDNQGHSVPTTVQYESEKDKPSTPSKEEVELNEKNLAANNDSPQILGKIHFKIRYNSDKGCVVVTVVQCTDLPPKDPPLGSCDPYVKLQLLPDKQHKAKTRVLRKTCSPEYDEDFTFYGITFAQLQSMSLHFVVLSFDRYSRDDVIGETITPLTEIENLDNADTQVALTRDIKPRNLKGRGELLVSLCHQPAANRLTVVVLKARNLPKMDITGLSDPYVKIYLLSNGQRVSKKKTHVKKRTLNPVFNESFVFDLPAGGKDLKEISLDFLLLDWDRVTKNEVIGRLELGGPRATGSALHHWAEVVNSPRRQIAEWHKLKE